MMYSCIGLALTLLGLGGTRNHPHSRTRRAGERTPAPSCSVLDGRWHSISRLHLYRCKRAESGSISASYHFSRTMDPWTLVPRKASMLLMAARLPLPSSHGWGRIQRRVCWLQCSSWELRLPLVHDGLLILGPPCIRQRFCLQPPRARWAMLLLPLVRPVTTHQVSLIYLVNTDLVKNW